jgi:hypothetical protein
MQVEVKDMFSIRNIGGVALFLAGTTWLWLTPAFAAKEVSTSGLAWTVTRILCLLTMASFAVATWGLFAQHSWWEPVALVSSALGILALIPYWLANTGGGGSTAATAYNAFIHVLMAAGVFALLLIPSLERWVNGNVMRS